MVNKEHLLFICTANVFRSKAAEAFFDGSEKYDARSAGIAPERGGVAVSQELINWADTIFVMSEGSDGHKTFLEKRFNIMGKVLYDLDIPNNYGDGPGEQKVLHELLREKLSFYFPLEQFK